MMPILYSRAFNIRPSPFYFTTAYTHAECTYTYICIRTYLCTLLLVCENYEVAFVACIQ